MRSNRLCTVIVALLFLGVCAAPAAAGEQIADQSGRVASPTVTGPVTGGRFGRPFTSSPIPLGPDGYTEAEYFVSGTATGYQRSGSWGQDGRWSVRPAEQAAYRSRILVRTPPPARFNGTVIVEWLNVSTGTDVDPDYLYDNAELLREGYGWVGVSAQLQGISALRRIDPARYGSLAHPGDTFSYDIFSQAAQALRDHGAGSVDPLPGLRAKALIADGESQSASRLSTYANAIQPMDRLFDGVLLHSRSASSAPISQAPQADQQSPPVVYSRTDLGVALLTVQTETDLFGQKQDYYPAPQEDSAQYRLWELAGMSHIDANLLTLGAAEIAPFVPNPPSLSCALPPNTGQERYVMDDALAQLNRWVRQGIPAKHAERIQVTGSSIVRDQYGNARGGIRTPALQVPIATLTGSGNSGSTFECPLLGTTTPFSAATLSALYPDHASYVARVTGAAVGDTVHGFLLPVDSAAIIRTAVNSAIPPN